MLQISQILFEKTEEKNKEYNTSFKKSNFVK
jgi:hypothetical protein